MKKVTGIGGIFFKCADPAKMNEWYEKHLGMPISPYGAILESLDKENPEKVVTTVWNPFPQDTKNFEPSTKEFMINYRVENLEAMLEDMKGAGVTVLDEVATYDFGKFVHILDPEGNKIELWEQMGE